MGSALLILLALVLISYYTRKRWIPLLFRFLIEQVKKRMQSPPQAPQRERQYRERETIFDPKPRSDKREKKAKESPGEYVDFEEID